MPSGRYALWASGKTLLERGPVELVAPAEGVEIRCRHGGTATRAERLVALDLEDRPVPGLTVVADGVALGQTGADGALALPDTGSLARIELVHPEWVHLGGDVDARGTPRPRVSELVVRMMRRPPR
jgi:hypothetical protein